MDKVLEKFINGFGVSGSEDEIKDILKKELVKLDCQFKEDNMGNIIVKTGGSKDKLMFTAQVDKIGLLVTSIDDSGKLIVSSLGNYKKENFVHTYVRLKNGTIGITDEIKDGNLSIDIGASSMEEALKSVREGDALEFHGECLEINNYITGYGVSERASLYVLYELIKEASKSDFEVYFVFSVESQLGGRGARAAAYEIDPKFAFIIGGGENKVKLESGPSVNIMNKNLIMNKDILDMLINAKEASKVNIQKTVSDEETYGALIQKERAGIKVGTVSIPTRYLNTMTEMISIKDIEDTINLLKKLL